MTFPKRILLVGNEPRVTRLVRQALEGSGTYLINEEQNSRTAFHTAKRFQPDVIFFDLSFDELDWTKAIRQIRADVAFRNTPIFMLRRSEAGDSVVYGGSFEGYEFSANPVTIQELLSCVNEMLEA
jgi:two-component system response regulator VicR